MLTFCTVFLFVNYCYEIQSGPNVGTQMHYWLEAILYTVYLLLALSVFLSQFLAVFRELLSSCSLCQRIWHGKFHIIIISIQPWRPGLTGTRAQSFDRYGSGTLHPGQVLGSSLSLLSPAFRLSHFSRQVPPSATTREILVAKGGTVGEKDVR